MSATCCVDAAIRPSLAARATASIRSSRSSKGVRFQRLQRGQTTHNRPFHSSNAIRRPTPRPEGPPSPSNAALQNAQLLNILGSKSLRGERGNLHLGFTRGDEAGYDVARQSGQEDAVAAVTGGVPQAAHVGIGADDGPAIRREWPQSRP